MHAAFNKHYKFVRSSNSLLNCMQLLGLARSTFALLLLAIECKIKKYHSSTHKHIPKNDLAISMKRQQMARCHSNPKRYTCVLTQSSQLFYFVCSLFCVFVFFLCWSGVLLCTKHRYIKSLRTDKIVKANNWENELECIDMNRR